METIDDIFNGLVANVKILQDNKATIGQVTKFLEKPVPDDKSSAQQGLNEAMELWPKLNRIKSKAKAQHYLARSMAAEDIPEKVKNYPKEAITKGKSAHYGYARDLTEGLFKGLEEKIRVYKRILSDLEDEEKF